MIDTHCHLTFRDFDGRVADVLAAARAAGVWGAVCVSTTTDNAAACQTLVHEHEGVWFSAGVHPLYADQPRAWEPLREIARDAKCVAWGELGLDNHYDEPPRPLQREVLEEQLAFIESCHAEGMSKPVIVHCRKSFHDLLPIFRASALDPTRFVFHCFTGTPDDARAVLEFGASISFTGVVTFKGAPEVAEAAALVPLDRMMVETDAPFLTPAPHRKVRPNEPKYIPLIAARLAEIKNVPLEEMDHQLDDNACRFFGIQRPVGV